MARQWNNAAPHIFLDGQIRSPYEFGMPEIPVKLIRKVVFNIGQAEMASIAGVNQATVSRWESGELTPGQEEMMAIRKEALRRKIDWKDEWFFNPKSVMAAANAAHHD